MGERPNAPIPDTHVPQTEGLQTGDHRFSISCAVVERPGHRCGDDLVFKVLHHVKLKFVCLKCGLLIICWPPLSLVAFLDTDECLVSNGKCSDTCINTIGSFYCSCRNESHVLAADQRTCGTPTAIGMWLTL